MTFYVFSTITNDTVYAEYQVDREINKIEKRVEIKGGANRASSQGRLVTPLGVMTKVSDDEMDWLKNNDAFKRHIEKGFITVRNSAHDPDKVAGDMESRDKSSPLTPSDYDDSGVPHPSMNKPQSDTENKTMTKGLFERLRG